LERVPVPEIVGERPIAILGGVQIVESSRRNAILLG